MPTKFHARAGKPYRPKTATRSRMFRERFCGRCELQEEDTEEFGRYSCPVLRSAMFYDIDEVGYPGEWVYDNAGEPTCMDFVAKTNEPPD